MPRVRLSFVSEEPELAMGGAAGAALPARAEGATRGEGEAARTMGRAARAMGGAIAGPPRVEVARARAKVGRCPPAETPAATVELAASVVRGAERLAVTLTPYPVRVTATGADELRNALDVLDFDELTLELRVLGFESGTKSLTVAVETAMQNESSDGWVTAATFTNVTAAPSVEVKQVTGILRYVRFNVTVFGTAPATFLVCGVGRSWGREAGA